MVKILLFTFYSFISQLCHAQLFKEFTLKQVDSLKKELSTHLQADSFRAHILQALGSGYYVNDPAAAERFCREALTISEKLNWVKGEVNSYQQLGTLALNSGNYIESLEYYQKSLSASEKLEDKVLTAHLKTNIAMIYIQSGEYDKALPFFKEAIVIMHEQKETKLESISLLNLGLAYFRKNDFLNA